MTPYSTSSAMVNGFWYPPATTPIPFINRKDPDIAVAFMITLSKKNRAKIPNNRATPIEKHQNPT